MAQPGTSFCPHQQASLIERCYRSALALNNIGVQLLVLECYMQATETLRDAAAMMQAVLVHTIVGNHGNINSGEGLVDLAMQRLAQPKVTKPQVMILDVLTRVEDGTLRNGENQAGSSIATLKCLLEAAPSSSVAYPIRLEDNILFVEPMSWVQKRQRNATEVLNLSSQAAIMLHNLGIAYLCQSKAVKRKADRTLASALHFFKISYKILVKQNNCCSQQKEREEAGDSLGCHCSPGLPGLLIAVLCTLIQTLHESLEDEEATKLYETLLQLRWSI
jgi:hypothetical protein